MKIVVDSNIVFSSILNTQSNLGQILINGSRYFDFYTIDLLKEEIIKHQIKIQQIAKLDATQFQTIYQLITAKICFVDTILLSEDDLRKAMNLTTDIDENDSMFVALNNHLHSMLWTGDKKLANGLKKKGYNRIISTDEMYSKYLEKEYKGKNKW